MDFRGQNQARFPPAAVNMLGQSPKPTCTSYYSDREDH